MDRAEKIFRESYSCVASTIDEDGFPLSATLSEALERTSYVTFFFYFEEQSIFVKSMKKNPKGTVSFSAEYQDRIEILVLKGTFTLEEDWELQKIRSVADEAKYKLKCNNPVIVAFETLHQQIEILNKYF